MKKADKNPSSSTLPANPIIRCFNVKFSPNLGDGLLSECLEHRLIRLGAHKDTWSIDLAAREAYGDMMAGRNQIMELLDSMPKSLRGAIVRLPLAIQALRKWGPHFHRGLEGANAVIVGGGNLISDIDLNFPTKLTLAFKEAEARDLPIVIYACGMATGWSRTGLRMCRKIFSSPNLKAVFLRDEDSVMRWNSVMAPHVGKTAEVVRDPGLMAQDLYPMPERAAGRRPVIGLGIMSHIAIRYHAENAPERAYLDQWYIDVAKGLLANGFQLRVFTNGSPEDKAYAAKLRDQLSALGGPDDVLFLEQTDPEGLCSHIAQFDVLIAYRMHAVIAAYSYGVPAIALAWDRKLKAFMESVNRGHNLCEVATTSAEACLSMVVQAYEEGIPAAEREGVLAEARADVSKAYEALFGRSGQGLQA
ncbi:MAG: polysaccharide pyruvyl transferase family protein [Pseudomonadota bacterium]